MVLPCTADAVPSARCAKLSVISTVLLDANISLSLVSGHALRWPRLARSIHKDIYERRRMQFHSVSEKWRRRGLGLSAFLGRDS
jgi:hypothetical protein